MSQTPNPYAQFGQPSYGPGYGGDFIDPSPRRTSILAITALVISIVGCIAFCVPAPAVPNVIVIIADDLSWRDLGCYGTTDVYTPAIDALDTTGHSSNFAGLIRKTGMSTADYADVADSDEIGESRASHLPGDTCSSSNLFSICVIREIRGPLFRI